MAAAPAKLPESPKQLAAQMSVAVQSALKGQCRLLEVRLPDGLCFGLFGKPPGKQMLGDPDDALIPAVQEQADRELAWLFVEMFQSYGDACCVVFPDSKAAKAAERDWSSTPLTPRVVGSLFELQGRRKAAAGFGGSRPKGSAGGAAPQVIVLVRPKASDVKAVERPEGGVVVLLNAGKWHQKRGYEAVYALQDNPHPGWRGGLLFRSYPSSWSLGVAGKVGAPRIYGSQDGRPTLEEIDRGFEAVKSDKGLISQVGGVLSAAGAAAALERRVAFGD